MGLEGAAAATFAGAGATGFGVWGATATGLAGALAAGFTTGAGALGASTATDAVTSAGLAVALGAGFAAVFTLGSGFFAAGFSAALGAWVFRAVVNFSTVAGLWGDFEWAGVDLAATGLAVAAFEGSGFLTGTGFSAWAGNGLGLGGGAFRAAALCAWALWAGGLGGSAPRFAVLAAVPLPIFLPPMFKPHSSLERKSLGAAQRNAPIRLNQGVFANEWDYHSKEIGFRHAPL
jgi:hypothetical protein